MEKLLVSACLLGVKCKYSGGSNAMDGDVLRDLREKYEIISVCPESEGGLPTPRTPSERVGCRVLSRDGADVTAEFRRGAQTALMKCRDSGCRLALLKENSPSCGSKTVYDGTFSGRLVPGLGVTAELLRENGIELYGESEVSRLI